MQKIVILDRDGVINYDSDDYIRSPEEWLPMEGSLEAIAHLHKAGYRIFVVSNQSGLARGIIKPEALEAIHEKMTLAVQQSGGQLERIFYCPHHPDDHCACRKPKTGLLEQLVSYLRFDIGGTPFIGDSLTDLQAAQSFGCLPILVRTGNGQETLAKLTAPLPLVFNDLAATAEWLINQTGPVSTHPG